MIHQRYDCNSKDIVGPGDGIAKTLILTRIITWTDSGIIYEANQRHAETVMQHFGLSISSNRVATPGTKEVSVAEKDAPLEAQESSMWMAARENYLGQDRPDLQYTIKELIRSMRAPGKNGWLKRIDVKLAGPG